MKESIQKLSTFLAEARKKAGLSLRAVEKATGISNAYLSQLEHGKIRVPAPQNLHKLAELYRVPYELLLELAGHPVQKSSDKRSETTLDSIAARFGSVTKEEEDELFDYLQFLRSRKRDAS
jgi:transcriptional regulator with XRE-family HTH domain